MPLADAPEYYRDFFNRGTLELTFKVLRRKFPPFAGHHLGADDISVPLLSIYSHLTARHNRATFGYQIKYDRCVAATQQFPHLFNFLR